MSIAVLGAQGQLGRDLVPRLPGTVQSLTRHTIDLDEPATIERYFAKQKPDVFINCAAYNLVDQAEADPTAAMRSNVWGVRGLAQACRAAGTFLVQISSDYVYGLDTTRNAPLEETDLPGPLSAYAMSKLMGEYVTQTFTPESLIVRTCGLYGVWGSGGKGGNFVETMLRVAGQGKPLKVVVDQRCTPTYTADLATTLAELVQRRATGLFHVTNAGDCSWHELAAEIFHQSGIDADLSPITTEAFAAPAKRPPYSVLSNQKLEQIGITPPRHWKEALAAYLAERRERQPSS